MLLFKIFIKIFFFPTCFTWQKFKLITIPYCYLDTVLKISSTDKLKIYEIMLTIHLPVGMGQDNTFKFTNFRQGGEENAFNVQVKVQ